MSVSDSAKLNFWVYDPSQQAGMLAYDWEQTDIGKMLKKSYNFEVQSIKKKVNEIQKPKICKRKLPFHRQV